MPIGRIYTVPLDAISVTNDADQDIFEIASNSAKQVILHGFSLTSSYTTDERARLRLIRRTASGSGGGTATSVAIDHGNAIAATATVETLNTTPGTGSTILNGWQWSQQGELLYLPTPEMRDVISVSSWLCLNLQVALGGTRTWSGWIRWEEF
jgi:hypothetical protein